MLPTMGCVACINQADVCPACGKRAASGRFLFGPLKTPLKREATPPPKKERESKFTRINIIYSVEVQKYAWKLGCPDSS